MGERTNSNKESSRSNHVQVSVAGMAGELPVWLGGRGEEEECGDAKTAKMS